LAELRPGQRDGRRAFSHSGPSPNASAVAPRVTRHLPEEDEPPRRCVSIVLWYRFCRVGSTTTYSRRPIRRYGRYHRLIVSCLHLWCDHTCARHLSQSETWCTWGMKAPLLVPGIAQTDENPMNTKESFSNSICKEQMQMAEREFSAFISGVKELLGPDQAQLSAMDWLDELELMDSQPGSTDRHWRAVTIATSARLANRLNAGQHHRSFAEEVV
jgi:hypothetical protein